MKFEEQSSRSVKRIALLIFLLGNLVLAVILDRVESYQITNMLTSYKTSIQRDFKKILDDYRRSFSLFTLILQREIIDHPDPNEIEQFLKKHDKLFLEIEGDTFDGLYMFYKNRYLYSWSTPYEVYAARGYNPKTRPWYVSAVTSNGKMEYTPPYLSYANGYMLSTISQLQDDGETVFAYDIKLGKIQELLLSMKKYTGSKILLFNDSGIIIGSSDNHYLGGNMYDSLSKIEANFNTSLEELNSIRLEVADHVSTADFEAVSKAEIKYNDAKYFLNFRRNFGSVLNNLRSSKKDVSLFYFDSQIYCCSFENVAPYNLLILVPATSMLVATMSIWLVPLLIVQILFVSLTFAIFSTKKNRELKLAYRELGFAQEQLESALTVAQRHASIDSLTGLKNGESFKKAVTAKIKSMPPDESAIFIMIDIDKFKEINDKYGHPIGDEAIKMVSRMILGRVRTIDIVSRLHGDEFAVFITGTCDFSLARRIMLDINTSLKIEACERNLPVVSISSGGVLVHGIETFENLVVSADAALYRAKASHNGVFSE